MSELKMTEIPELSDWNQTGEPTVALVQRSSPTP